MTSLPDLSALATHLQQSGQTQRGGDPTLTVQEYLHAIEQGAANDPRSLQTRIGPSGLGHECTRCLARMLAGVPKVNDGDRWLTTVGKAVHAWLAEVFDGLNAAQVSSQFIQLLAEQGQLDTLDELGTGLRYLTELPVDVGQVAGQTITGSLDLYDACTAEVTDWKIVGATTLRTVRTDGEGCPAVYRRQVQLYGYGATRRGLPVDTVRVAFLPRNEPDIRKARVWSAPYDEADALATLARADGIGRAMNSIKNLPGDTSLRPGTSLLDLFIEQLPAHPGCFDCPRFGDYTNLTAAAVQRSTSAAADLKELLGGTS